MSIPRSLKLGIVTVLPLALAAGIWFAATRFQKNVVPPPPPVKETPVTAVVQDTVVDDDEATDDETESNSCGLLNTWAKVEGADFHVPDALKFRAQVNRGEAVTYALPFDLDKDLNFDLTLESAGDGSIQTVAHCRADQKTLRCTEVYAETKETFCGPLKLADGTQKFVQLDLEVKWSVLPLPAHIDQFAVRSDAQPMGLVKGSSYDAKSTDAEKIYRTLPIQVWESSDANAKLLGTVPGGYFQNLEAADPNSVYIEKVGDRYLSNILANSKEDGKKSRVYHWISQVDAVSYEDYVRDDYVTCNNLWLNLCKDPTSESCKNSVSVDRSEYQVDKDNPLLRKDGDWVIFKAVSDKKLPNLYMPLDKFPANTVANCD